MLSNKCKDFQLVLQVTSHEVISRKPIRRTKRSFGGCLNCKRKKIKCDETKSRCNNCTRSDLDCSWPAGKGSEKPKESEISSKAPEELLLAKRRKPHENTGAEQKLRKVNRWDLTNGVQVMNGHSFSSNSGLASNTADKEMNLVDGAGNLTKPGNNRLRIENADAISANLKLGPELEYAVDQTSAITSEQQGQQPPAYGDSDFVLNPIDEFQNLGSVYDSYFYAHFANRFLPTIAQPHFHHALPQKNLFLSAGTHSEMLQEIFVACGASLVAFDHPLYASIAREKYEKALLHFLRKIKDGVVQGDEDWFFVAVQVLQTLCLRDAFGGSNATRCAAHLGAAYKIVVLKILERSQRKSWVGSHFSPLEKVLIENFMFNYSITILFCDHTQLAKLVPDPFEFFTLANDRLTQMSSEDGSPQSSRMSLLSFQIAAKCSWLCRLSLPLSELDRKLHFEMLLLAETILFSLELVDFTALDILVKNTVSIAKIVLRASIILMRKMLDMVGVRAMDLQDLVSAIVQEVDQVYNKDIIFPIWALMIGASAALNGEHRQFFKEKLQLLMEISKSKIALQVLNHLDGLWEIYKGEEPFEFLFDTLVLDQVCN